MEKYGTIPKKFTKAWWEYFWEYYKWHTIATAFVLCLVGITAHQCSTQIHYDTTITVLGGQGFDEELLKTAEADLTEITDDCNGDGEKHVTVQQLISPTAQGGQIVDSQYEMAIASKIMVEFAAGESCLYIMSEDETNNRLNDEATEGFFVPVQEWSNNLPDNSKLMSAKGVAYAVSLADSKFFAERGIDASGYYITVRNPRYDEVDDAVAIARTESAKKIAAYIIGE